jgi:hypothetical protein
MEWCRKPLSIVLVGLLVFANAACACANVSDGVSDNDPHAHHQMQAGAADVGNSLCPHQECEDCKSPVVAATPERDASVAGCAKLGPDDDVVWIETAADNVPLSLPLLARAGPALQSPHRRAETPVRRADLLLE